MELVTKKEAARRLGVSLDTVERRLHKGELQGHKEPRPQGYIWLIEMPEEWGGTATNGASADVLTQVCTCACTGELRRLEKMVDLLEAQVGSQQKQSEQQLESKDKQIGELHVLLKQAQQKIPQLQPGQGSQPREDQEQANDASDL